MVSNLTLPSKSKSMSTQNHYLCKLGRAHIHIATYQVQMSLGFGSREEDFYRVFTLYGRGGHLGHVTITVCKKIASPYDI